MYIIWLILCTLYVSYSVNLLGCIYAKIMTGSSHLHVFNCHLQATHHGQDSAHFSHIRHKQLLELEKFIHRKTYGSGDAWILTVLKIFCCCIYSIFFSNVACYLIWRLCGGGEKVYFLFMNLELLLYRVTLTLILYAVWEIPQVTLASPFPPLLQKVKLIARWSNSFLLDSK